MSTRRVSLTQFEQIVLRFEPRIRAAYVHALRASAMRLEGMVVEEIDRAQPYAAVDTGELRRSVDTTFVPDGAVVSVNAPHAAMIEHGTRPFVPPIEPLAEWALRKGLAQDPAGARRVAWAVRRAIASRGIAPRRYFAKAWARLPPVLRAETWKALAKMGS